MTAWLWRKAITAFWLFVVVFRKALTTRMENEERKSSNIEPKKPEA